MRKKSSAARQPLQLRSHAAEHKALKFMRHAAWPTMRVAPSPRATTHEMQLHPSLQLFLDSKWGPKWVADDGTYAWEHFVQTLWVAAALLAVRFVAEKTVLVALRKRLGKSRAKGVFDNAYVVVFATLTEVLAVYVTLKLNGGCTPWSTDSCLTGWPKHAVHVLQKWYMVIMFQFYNHEMVGAVFGMGPKLKADMVIHHFATMGLISVAYSLNLSRYGIMWQALFDTSNPLLHAAKSLHSAQIKQLEGVKWLLFNLFALVFFVCRVAMAPASILYPAITRAFSVLPDFWAALLMCLMAIVCGLQWIWFSKIVAMAMGQGGKDEDEAEADDGDKQTNGAAGKKTQ